MAFERICARYPFARGYDPLLGSKFACAPINHKEYFPPYNKDIHEPLGISDSQHL